MNAKQLERAAYLAAYAVGVSAPQLATFGSRHSHTIDAIADTIRNVFEPPRWEAPHFD